MTVRQWSVIGEEIALHYNDYDGFVILHGTDTMCYTASALSFMLENLNKPVILTGSQIPLCEIRSDGRDNIIASLLIAAEGKAKEVCLFFAGRLLRGNRSTKISSDGLIAFASPNYPPLASAGINIKYDTAALKRPAVCEDDFSFTPQTSSYRRFEILSRNPVQPLRIYNDRISQGDSPRDFRGRQYTKL